MTKVLHLAGHNYKWNLDSYFEHEIGDGFVFTAYSLPYGAFGGKLSGYKPEQYLDISSIDTQYYGNKKSQGGKLSTYPFHPVHDMETKTIISGPEMAEAAVKYQQSLGVKNIIIPNFFCESVTDVKIILDKIHKKIMRLKREDELLFMTLCFSNRLLSNDKEVEHILQSATSMDINFDGYYLVFEPKLGYKQKISTDLMYYTNVLKILKTLKLQKFKTLVSYANFDILVFLSLCDIDYVTIGTYENLRSFSIGRFTENTSGGPSKGWYFSEKLLNFVKAEYIDFFRSSNCTNKIANEKNIFSDVILDNSFVWDTTHRPPIHKNYLLSLFKVIKKLSSINNITDRSQYFLNLIDGARSLYKDLNVNDKIFLEDESSDYHLAMWKSFILRNS